MSRIEPIGWARPIHATRSGRDAAWGVTAAAAILHGALFYNDVAGDFEPFLRGDRAGIRWESFERFVSAPPGMALDILASNEAAPGEFLLQYPAYLVAGVPGIVLFQVGLFLVSLWLVCRIAWMLLPTPAAVLAVGLVYALLPHNLAFPHQFVTEAVATPLCVIFLYLALRALDSRRHAQAAFAGLALGLAILARPSLAIALPLLIAGAVLFRRRLPRGAVAILSLAAMASLAPTALWVATFTATTGSVGYTSGVANLGWNLRSKVFLVQSNAGLEPAPEVREFTRYEDMWSDPSGIGVARFLEIAAEHPGPFLRAAITDVAIVLTRGNSTKLTVDYMGSEAMEEIKTWRDHLDSAGLAGLLRWVADNRVVAFLFSLELAASLLTGLASALVLAFCAYSLAFPARVSAALGPLAFALVLTTLVFLATAVASGLVVDRAQGRMRHPAEAGMLVTLGLAWVYLRGRARLRAEGRLRADGRRRAAEE